MIIFQRAIIWINWVIEGFHNATDEFDEMNFRLIMGETGWQVKWLRPVPSTGIFIV